ncbi:N-acetyltransferase [Kitasatospora sp. NPDC051914]|uniref:GNAT family N-acetyltransferase n=1 Tax=Kitasatospora sp. NPDC051914 TaxID=3154945 RepID=UPI00344A009F
MTWLPEGFDHPLHVPLTVGHHLRPIAESDTALDHPAVMGSRERLWSFYGETWGWPPATMTFEQDRVDLARHADEMVRHESFNYALFDTAETALLGCVYIDPVEDEACVAEVSWWVVDEQVGSAVEKALDVFVPSWLADRWPFERVVYSGPQTGLTG